MSAADAGVQASSRRRRSVQALSGNVAYAASQLVVLLLLVRFTSTADVGRYALALAITAPIQVGLGMKLRSVRAIEQSPDSVTLSVYLRAALAAAALAVCVSTALALIVIPDRLTQVTVTLVALCKAVESLLEVCYGEHQRTNRIDRMAASHVVRGGLTIVGVAAGASSGGGLTAAVTGMLCLWSLQLVVELTRLGMITRHRAAPNLRANAPQMSGLLATTWPLGLGAALISLLGMSPRYVVASTMSNDALGIFALFAYPATVMGLFANSLCQASFAHLGELARRGARKRFRRLVGSLLLQVVTLGVIGMASVWLMGDPLIALAFGPELVQHRGFAVVMVAVSTATGVATVGHYALLSTTRFRSQPIISAASFVVGLPLMYVGTSHYGLKGTAAAMLLTYGLQSAGMFSAVKLGPPRRAEAR